MSKAPWCVGPSSPTRPARSIAKTTFELLQADVVDDLVEGALQEGRVDRADRLGALEREAGGEQHRLLLGDADVEVLLGQLLLQDRRGRCREFIAAVIPITRGSRRASATIASPKTLVYCGGAGLAAAAPSRVASTGTAWRGSPSTIDLGLAACHFSMPSRPPSSAGAKPLPLTVAMWTTTGRSAAKRLAQRARAGRATSWPSITPM